MATSRTHTVLVTVTFDKPCGAPEARYHVRQNVHGDFYPSSQRENGPELMRIRSVKPAPRNA